MSFLKSIHISLDQYRPSPFTSECQTFALTHPMLSHSMVGLDLPSVFLPATNRLSSFADTRQYPPAKIQVEKAKSNCKWYCGVPYWCLVNSFH